MTNINLLPKEFRKHVNKINYKTKAAIMVIFLGIASLGLIQNNVAINGEGDVRSSARAFGNIEPNSEMANIIFGGDTASVNSTLDGQVRFISTRPAFSPSLKVVQKHEDTIRRQARAKGVPEDVAIGIAFLENGGSETAVSVAGAAGMYQFMPSTARSYNLVVSRYQDDRLNPEKATEAAMNYLQNNYKLLGDWGLAIWSYHAGAGNVCKAVKIYAGSYGSSAPDCNSNIADYVVRNGITIDKLLTNASVKNQLTDKLSDDSAGYPYKVMTTAYLFDLAKKLGNNKFSQRVLLLNAKQITLAAFFQS